MSGVKGVILCGGEGKRFRPLSFYLQKVMVPVGPYEKPILEYIVRLFHYYGVKDLVLLVGYKSNQVQNYFGDGARFDVKISYVKDDPNYPGNGGALYNAFRKGALREDETLIVYYGDILSRIDLRAFLEFHEGAVATLAVAEGYRVPVGVAKVRGERVVYIEEKPVLNMPITIGVLVIEGTVKGILEEFAERKKKLDIMGDIIPALIKRGMPVKAYMYKGFWYDVGSLERLEKLSDELVKKELSFLFSD